MNVLQQHTALPTYAAFISYRHLPQDTEVAQAVQRAIEGFRLPRGVASAQRAGEGGLGHEPEKAVRTASGRSSRRLGKCFRDEDELAATHSLPDSIHNALERSSSLVLICTPETKESDWVRREVETFIELHGRERVICVLAAGDSATSIPPYLRTALVPDADGALRRMPTEPLAADLRPESKAKRKAELLRIVAAVAGCNFDDLRRREHARRIRRSAIAAIGMLALIALVGSLALHASSSNREALIAESTALAAQAREHLSQGERIQAVETALSALPASEHSLDRPLVPEAEEALAEALTVYSDVDTLWRPKFTIDASAPITQFCADTMGTWVATLDKSGTVSLWDGKNGKLRSEIDLRPMASESAEFNIDEWGIFPGGTNRILVGNRAETGDFAAFDARTGEWLWSYDDACVSALSMDGGGIFCAVFTIMENGSLALSIFNTETGDVEAMQETDNFGLRRTEAFLPSCFSLDEGIAAVGTGNCALCFNLNEEQNYLVKELGAVDTVINSLVAAPGTLLAGSLDISSGPKDFSGLDVPYEFEANIIPITDRDPLWEAKGTIDQTVLSKGGQDLFYHGDPTVQCLLQAETLAAACTTGQTILALSCSDGQELYRQDFEASIVGASSLYHRDIEAHENPPIFIALSDGTIDVRATSDNTLDHSNTWQALLPSPIDAATFAPAAEDGVEVIARSASQPERLYGYQYIMSSRYSERNLSLDELIAKAHKLLGDA